MRYSARRDLSLEASDFLFYFQFFFLQMLKSKVVRQRSFLFRDDGLFELLVTF